MFNRRKDQKEEPGAGGTSSSPENSANGEKRTGMDLESSVESRAESVTAREVNAYFGKGSKFSGKLCFEGVVRVDGKVEGEIQSSDTLIIGEGAEVRANIHVTNVYISGSVGGDIIANGRIELTRAGRLNGNIRTPVFVIQEGGSFNGRCTMTTTGLREEWKTGDSSEGESGAEKDPAAPAQQLREPVLES